MAHHAGDLTNSVSYNAPPTGEFVARDAAADQTYVSHEYDYGADQTIVNHGGVVANPQVTQGPTVTPEYGKPRTESVAQIASAAAIASNAQQHLLGDHKMNPPTPSAPGAPGAPRRGLGTIFSDITMGKKNVKPGGAANPGGPANANPSAADAKTTLAGQPGDTNKAGVKPVEPNQLMGRMRDSVDGEVTIQMSTNQSLERQMLDAGAHVQSMPASTLGSILGKTNASNPQKPSEHLNNALVDYHTVVGLLREGKSNDAALVAGNALANVSRCTGSEPQLLPLVRAFVELFNQRGMIHQAKAFADKEKALDELAKATPASPSSNDNIWGS